LLKKEHLGLMRIKRVIFHDVPNHQKGAEGHLVLATAETTVDAHRRNMLQTKLTKVLDSKAAYPILFSPETGSPVPKLVRTYTCAEQKEAVFVQTSQTMAKHLNDLQHGAISPGLLCVIEISADGKPGLVVMKLEREAGAQLKVDTTGNKTRFSMEVLDDLVLTDGTKLFKTAAFVRIGKSDNDFLMSACDNQHRVTDSGDMARFWIRFLGCMFREDPRVATQKFFSATIDFINTVVTDPIIRTEMYDSLHAELRSKRTMVAPKTFIEEYVPDEVKGLYQEFLGERKISLTSFHKDLMDIQSKLRRRTFLSERGVVVSAPESDEELVTVTEENIVVQDKLKKVGRG